MSIRYTTTRKILSGEQLYICYGREEDMWWNGDKQIVREASSHRDDWQAISNIEIEDQ